MWQISSKTEKGEDKPINTDWPMHYKLKLAPKNRPVLSRLPMAKPLSLIYELVLELLIEDIL